MRDADLQRIHDALGAGVVRTAALSGGCVGDVRRVDLDDGRSVVAKLDPSASPRLDVEGAMLDRLGAASGLPVPAALLAEPDLLVMEWVEADGRSGPEAERHAADLLADLHAAPVAGGLFGLDFDTLIGGLHQPNPPTTTWREFFARHRLIAMAQQAHEAGRLPAETRARIDRLTDRLEGWIAEPEAPSLIHGDVWGGNVLCHRGRIAAFIDPAIYHADPEIELAFTTLFGTFGEPFFARYAERRPIAEGFFEQRRDLYNLYPLLVHVRLFGGGYLHSVEKQLSRFGV